MCKTSDRAEQFCQRKEGRKVGREGVTDDLLDSNQGLSQKLGLSGQNTWRTKARVFCFVDKVLNFQHLMFNANFRIERFGI